MKKNEKVEKPEWIQVVESLPEIIQQNVGNLCASVLASLVQLYFISVPLYDAVRNEADTLIRAHYVDLDRRLNDDKDI